MQKPATNSLMNPETRRCPFDFYRQLRREAPVYKLPETDIYFVSTYQLVMQVIKDSETFNSKGKYTTTGPNYCEKADRLMDEKGWGRLFSTVPTLRSTASRRR
jgi:cytochrome P450